MVDEESQDVASGQAGGAPVNRDTPPDPGVIDGEIASADGAEQAGAAPPGASPSDRQAQPAGRGPGAFRAFLAARSAAPSLRRSPPSLATCSSGQALISRKRTRAVWLRSRRRREPRQRKRNARRPPSLASTSAWARWRPPIRRARSLLSTNTLAPSTPRMPPTRRRSPRLLRLHKDRRAGLRS